MSPATSSQHSDPFSVAIVGGGIAGVALALALHDRGFRRLTLYEKASEHNAYGAAVALEKSAVNAMKIASTSVYTAFSQVATFPPDARIFSVMRDGYHEPSNGQYLIPWDGFTGGCHRGHFHNAMTARLPSGILRFSKALESLHQDDEAGDVVLNFADGSQERADLVIGCDGLGSHIRRHLVGADHPSARARYTHRYIYRMMVPAQKVWDALGGKDELLTKTNTMWCGKGGELVVVTVDSGTMISIQAVFHDPNPWADDHHTVVAATREEVLRDTQFWKNATCRALLENVSPQMDKWAIFDLAENPVPFFVKGRIALLGDAAHASTPHLGAGAGFAMEDVAVLSEMLGHPSVWKAGKDGIEPALKAYETTRYERATNLPIASRIAGNALLYMDEDDQDDINAVGKHWSSLTDWAWNADPHLMVKEAKITLLKYMAAEKRQKATAA